MTDTEQLRREIESAVVDGKVPCKVLLAMAERLDVPPAQLGQLCNEMNLKVRACQLGCFR